jgi:predicted metal-binding protein
MQFDSDLRRIIAAWDTLPEHLKRAMLALIS